MQTNKGKRRPAFVLALAGLLLSLSLFLGGCRDTERGSERRDVAQPSDGPETSGSESKKVESLEREALALKPGEPLVKTWKPGDKEFDESGRQRRELTLDDDRKNVLAFTDFSTDSELFENGVSKVYYEFKDGGIRLSDFETYGTDAYALIQMFDEDDREFKSVKAEGGGFKYIDENGNVVKQTVWADTWPSDGSLLSWRSIQSTVDSLPDMAIPGGGTIQESGNVVEYCQGRLVGTDRVVSMTRLFGTPVRFTRQAEGIPVIPGCVHVRYANVVWQPDADYRFVVYFERFRVYLDFVGRPIFAMDERTGKLAFVYHWLVSKWGDNQKRVEVIWRKKVEDNQPIGRGRVDVLLGPDRIRVSGKEKTEILAQFPEPIEKWKELVPAALKTANLLGEHVPVVPR